MNWSTSTWEQTQNTYTKITELPFIKELANGTLPQEKFHFYIQQDAYYLNIFGRVLSGIACKLVQPEYKNAFLKFSGDTMMVESALHQAFISKFPKQSDIEISPSCMLYTSYLSQQLWLAPIEVAMASILPCFWIYKKVGDHILKEHNSVNNPYQAWIDTYSGEEFGKAVALAISICDQYAERTTENIRKEMTSAYAYSSKMEWMFWESAYKQERWPL